MNTVRFVVDCLIHLSVALALPPLLLGIINKIKAWFAGRVGPPLFQSYYDLVKLVRKGSVFSRTTTWVFKAGPVAGLASMLLAILIVPLGGERAPISFSGDVILFAYLLGLSRFFTVAAALDTGSAFEGMGSAREMTFACLAEPTLFLGFLALAHVSGSLSLSEMLGGSLIHGWAASGGTLALILAAWLIVLLAENCRIPFDDPNTHLELTMIHEVMVLDHGGPAFGMILYSASLKLLIFGGLCVRIAFPFIAGLPVLGWLIFIAGTLAVVFLVGVTESTMARFRMPRVPQMLVGACLLSGLGALLLVR